MPVDGKEESSTDFWWIRTDFQNKDLNLQKEDGGFSQGNVSLSNLHLVEFNMNLLPHSSTNQLIIRLNNGKQLGQNSPCTGR